MGGFYLNRSKIEAVQNAHFVHSSIPFHLEIFVMQLVILASQIFGFVKIKFKTPIERKPLYLNNYCMKNRLKESICKIRGLEKNERYFGV